MVTANVDDMTVKRKMLNQVTVFVSHTQIHFPSVKINSIVIGFPIINLSDLIFLL